MRVFSIMTTLAILAALVLSGCSQAPQSSAAQEQTTAAAESPTESAEQVGTEDFALLRQQQRAFEELYEQVRPSVVQIGVLGPTVRPDIRIPDFFPGLPFEFGLPEDHPEFRQQGQGSGFVYDADGHIVTNHHVVANAEEIRVRFSDDTEREAELVGSDPFSDLAVIRVDSLPEGVEPLTLGTSEDLRVGQIVVALGSPFGLPGSMTSGIISGLGRDLPTGATPFRIPNVIQTDAAINPGNSGGPLLDLEGRVIGVNTAIESPSGAFAGVGFAVPVDQVKKVAPALIAEGEYRYPWMGVEILSVTPTLAEELNLPVERGALIAAVSANSPAEAAGLQGGGTTREVNGREIRTGGDIIVEFDGMPVISADDVIDAILEHEVGDTVALTIVRDGQEQTVSVTLAERPGRLSNE